MSMFGLVIFAIFVLAACYTTRCLHRGARRDKIPREIERLL